MGEWTEEGRRFRALGHALDSHIDALNHPANNPPTPRREAHNSKKRQRAERLAIVRAALFALADAWDADSIPASLAMLDSRKHVELLHDEQSYPFPIVTKYDLRDLAHALDSAARGPIEALIAEIEAGYDAPRSLSDPGERASVFAAMQAAINGEDVRGRVTVARLRKSVTFEGFRVAQAMDLRTPDEWARARADLFALIDGYAPEGIDLAARLRIRERDLIARRVVPDFVPTPGWLAHRLVTLAEIVAGHVVLEPSAGAGAICEAVALTGAYLQVIERAEPLREILTEKGFAPIGRDFFEYRTLGLAVPDRIVMNPPFTGGEWMRHVREAVEVVADGGRVVTVIPRLASLFGKGATAEFEAFRQFVIRYYYDVMPVPGEPFADSGYNVSASILVIDKIEKGAGEE